MFPTATYDPWLVLLSVVVAIFASYVALTLARRIAASRTSFAARTWLAGGALAMGAGIWAMHFIGMLAHRWSASITYDGALTAVSFFLAVLISGFALWIPTRTAMSRSGCMIGGALMGLGIATMHYLGMAAMNTGAHLHYDPPLLAASIVIAIGVAISALAITFRHGREAGSQWHKLISASVMGLAISGMHYTGMLATHISAQSPAATTAASFDNWQLGMVIAGSTFFLLVTALLVAVVDSHLGTKATEYAQQLMSANIKLGAKASELAKANERLQEEIDERRRSEAHITFLAHHDSLTNLPNRRLFSDHVNHAIRQADRYGKQLAVLLIDLDRFKTINDTKGHDAGDLLLQEIAVRLKHCLREGDIVARLGGDEFVILLEELPSPSVVAHVAQKILSVTRWPFIIQDQEFYVTASIGISLYPQNGADEQGLLKTADMAMYRSKEAGKNRYHFYSEDLNSAVSQKLALETHLRHALERNQIEMHYQPKVDLRTGALSGVEALMRWTHPELGNVAPSVFIPLAEETGLIHSLGKWALEQACVKAVEWRTNGMGSLNVAVNLSVRQFDNDKLHSEIADILQSSGMDPGMLELEITESMFMRNLDAGLATVMRLKSAGVRIAIDDFGTGFSSLSTLKHLPIDTLKVDGAFIHGLPSDAKDQGITRAIINMAKTLKVTVVAEAVETKEQLDFLRLTDCDLVQGYFYSKPVSATQLDALLAAKTRFSSPSLALH
ncbi:EAL domain-containing protein [Herbaspirillum sp. GCM10030257]|uniref:bifunctional diguanylate cyclase/phosphodiesterase n=1 Tax=Herbaspirillum sp. GCM10030257 TaxID=3273393 RepID=UPI003621F069